jgi:hypothetical protein
MGRCQRWKNVPGHFAVCFSQTAEGPWLDDDDKPLPPELVAEVKRIFRPPWEECFELVINFRCSGFYDPGQLSGPPERCYPPEGEDERLLDRATVNVWRDKPQALAPVAAQRIFDFYEEKILEVEMEYDPPGRDRDDY